MTTPKKSYAQMVREDRRLVILRLLNESSGKQSNSSLLHAGLIHLKIICERHELIDDLRFLQTHSLIDLEQLGDVNPDLYGAHLRGRGEDLLAGRLEVEGVSRPRRS
jgi:hypothetical protein